MDDTQLTHDEVDELEIKIETAIKTLEEAAQILCPIPGDVAPLIYNQLAKLANGAREVFHECYRLRPWD